MQVEIRLAAAISSTVMNRKTAEDANALVAATSNNPIPHLITAVNTTARIASAVATPRKSGTRYIRSFATLLSITAMPTARTATFASSANNAIETDKTEKVVAIPHGANSAISSASTTVSLMALAHSIRARLGPEYSSTMAS